MFPAQQQGARAHFNSTSLTRKCRSADSSHDPQQLRENRSSLLRSSVNRTFYRRSSSVMAGRGKLIAVIGDEDTCTGFLLGGVGELNKNRKPNFLVVEKDTSITEIEETFK